MSQSETIQLKSFFADKFLMIRVLIALAILMLIPFQNCSQFRGPASLPSPNNGAPLTEDPLLTGKTLPGSAYARDRYTNASTPQGVNIKALDDSGYLSNGYINIKMDSQFPSQLASSSQNFNYAISTPQFRQTNAYYHALRLIEEYRQLGFDLNTFVNIRIDTHCEAPSNAYFNSSQNRVCLGYVDLSPRRYAADDSDVMIHELNHGINRILTSNEILSSSPELGAIDEGLSDFWSNMLNNSPAMAPYYGRAIFLKAYNAVINQPLRTAIENPLPKYPSSLVHEVHDDGLIFNSALWAISQALPSNQLDNFKKAVARALQLSANRDGFKQLTYNILQEATSLGLDTATIQAQFTDFGFYRTDDLNQLSLPSSGAVQVIDEPISGFTNVGNCNSVFEANEENLVVINFNNTGAELSSVEAEILSADAGLLVLPGGDIGSYLRFKANKEFIQSLPIQGDKSTLTDFRYGAVVASAFGLKALTAGTFNIVVRIKSFSSITGTTQSRDFTIPIVVGAVPTVKTCMSGQNPWL